MTHDSQTRQYFPAWRVFVFGVEVTDDVVSCNVNFSDGRAPNTAEFELVSAGVVDDKQESQGFRQSADNDRYIIDERDIKALYGGDIVFRDLELADQKTVVSDVQPDLASQAAPSVASTIAGAPAGSSISTYVSTFNTQLAQRNEDVKAQILDALDEAAERIKLEVPDPIKKRVLDKKFREFQDVDQPPFDQVSGGTVNSIRAAIELQGQAMRYPFQVGDCIFHSNDPVRIFWRDPRVTSKGGNEPGVWYHMFTGFVTDWVDRVDENDTRSVTLRCEDPTRVLRYSRITTNPGVFDIDSRQQVNDTAVRTLFNNSFANLTLVEFMWTLLFGSVAADTLEKLGTAGAEIPGLQTFTYRRVGIEANTDDRVAADAAGAFNPDRSLTLLFPIDGEAPDETENATLDANVVDLADLGNKPLAIYQAIVDHQVFESDLDNLALPTAAAQRELEIIKQELVRDTITNRALISDTGTGGKGGDVITALGTRPEVFPVDNGRLIILAPKSLGPTTNRNLLLKDIGTVDTNTSWRSRLGLIYDLMERIEFSFYASPKGDLICEMPLYDFEPDDFGRTPVSLQRFQQKLADTAPVGANAVAKRLVVKANEVHGPFQPQYSIQRRDTISWERSFSDEQVRTMMLCWPSPFQAYASNLPGTTKILGLDPNISFLQALVPQFGVRAEQVDPKGLIASPQAAKLYATIKLNQINADARSAHIDALPNVCVVFPNRPLEFAERKYIATTRQINHSIVWNSDMGTSYDVNYVRGWSGLQRERVIDGRRVKVPVYEPLAGAASQPLNYSVLFNPNKFPGSTKERSTTSGRGRQNE